MLQAINKFEATHVFTQDSEYRYDIDVNVTFLLGSPIEPVKVFSNDEYTGRLWEVESTRLEQADWWRNNTVQIYGTGVHYGDFVWLEINSNFEAPAGTGIFRIYETDLDLDLTEAFDVLSQQEAGLICNSIEECSSFVRSEHLDSNWGVWMTQIDP